MWPPGVRGARPMPSPSLAVAGALLLVTAAVPAVGPLLLQGPGTYENPLGGPTDAMAFATCAHHARDVVHGTVTVAWQPHGAPLMVYAFRAAEGSCAVERTCALDADPGPDLDTECTTVLGWGPARLRGQQDGAYHLRAFHTTVIMDLEVVDAILRPVA